MSTIDKILITILLCVAAATTAYAYETSKSGAEYSALLKAIEKCKGNWTLFVSKYDNDLLGPRFKCEVSR